MPLALSTPGTAGQLGVPTAPLLLAGSIPTNNLSATNQLLSLTNTNSTNNTNTSQNSSWLSAIEGYPSQLASTVENLVYPLATILNPGTSGGAYAIISPLCHWLLS